MEDTLVEVRASAVKTLAEKRELERRIAGARKERDGWDARAELALSRGRDDLAKAALVAKARYADAIADHEKQLADIDAAVGRTSEDIGKLQAKLTEAKQREKVLVVRHEQASNRVRIREKLHDERIHDALSRFEHVERQLDELEGKAEALAMGRGKSLADEFATLEADARVEEEFAALKARVGGRAPRDG
jgi:phage shock protein A